MANNKFPFGGTVKTLAEVQPLLKKLAEKAPRLADAALLFTVPGFHTDFQNVLVLPGDSIIEGDFVLDCNQKWVQKNRICMVLSLGDLQIERDILNRDEHFWPLLAVDGDLRAVNIVKGGMPLLIWGNLELSGYMVPDYNDGPLRLGKDLRALGYVPACRDSKDGRGHVIGGKVLAKVLDAREGLSGKELRRLLVPGTFQKSWLDNDAVLAFGHEGRDIFRDEPLLEEPQPEPVEILAPDGVDPTALGTIESPDAVLPMLLCRISEKIAYDPDRYSYPESFAEFVRSHFEYHKSMKVLTLPGGSVIKGDLLLDFQEAWAMEKNISAVVCDGHLTVAGDALNSMLEGGILLFVSGNLQVENLIKGGATVMVLGDVLAGGLVIGVYNDGVMRIGGDLTASAYFLLDHDGYVRGKVEALSHTDDDGDWCELLLPHVFDDEEDFHPNVDKIRACQKTGRAIFASV